MWFLLTVARGSKFHEPESRIGNLVLVSDTTDIVITGRASDSTGYRFEMRRGNDSFVVREFTGPQPTGELVSRFRSLAHQLGATIMAEEH